MNLSTRISSKRTYPFLVENNPNLTYKNKFINMKGKHFCIYLNTVKFKRVKKIKNFNVR